ncbi:hypothetical protein [Mycolicibacterium mucogenicum]|uniref:Major tail protein n=1 Tax=Mycolicibacterium mucogenicum DSM 44124 TaxID=1226753 RepID=A0A8H2PF83_MYCMU|nr:hypothetical protein [Mycolicibacterium mucogenicum]KAB7761182.1 hypothetical protein MMUC44124_00875 [Mycolicibacterium mucogenicum DSM 44124]QPG69988.1 hypothetical protein C1S78_002870 [Mycolicibacterium mucogenicum DSM 44124]
MATFTLIKGTKLRITKVNSCGKPIAGPANYLVTDGFVRVAITPVMKDRKELEQENAEGKVCFSDTTPATRKHHNVEVEMCNVNTGVITLLNGWPQVLNHADVPIGYEDRPDVDGDYGVMIEVWTAGRSDDDCVTPTTDADLASSGSGKKYGYLAIAATEWTLDGITVSADVSTLKFTGISIAATGWGRGPYNVMEIDDDGTPGRLLTPMGQEKSHYRAFRTGVKPPEVTPGDGPCELAIASIFTLTAPYYGAPGGVPPVDVAPAQPICGGKKYTVAVTGTGNFSLKVGTEDTAAVSVTALPAALLSAIEALPGVAVGQVQVSGSAGNYTVTLDPSLPALTAGATVPTGGTATVTPA